MSVQRGILGIVAVCLVVILLSALGLVSGLATRLEFNIDGLLLLAVCLMMGGIFTLMLLLIAKDAGWVKFPHRKSGAQPAANKPGQPASGQGK